MIAIVGFGFWGPNFARIANQAGLLSCVVDLSEEQQRKVKEFYPDVRVTGSVNDVLRDETIQGIIIATPASTHRALAQKALEAGKHVLVEKPLATTLEDAQQLVELAKKQKVTLMVGHTFEYHPALRALKREIENGTLGSLYYLYSTRVNLGQIQNDVNAMWNLAPHDISIANYLTGSTPLSVRAIGHSYLQEGVEDVVFMTLEYPNNVLVHIHVSWLDPAKIRKLVVVGSKKMAVFNETAEKKLEIADKGAEPQTNARKPFALRSGNTDRPIIPLEEPLKNEFNDFVNAINGGTPHADGMKGVVVVHVLEAAQKSLKNNGERVQL